MTDICFFPSEQKLQGLSDYRVLFLEMEFHQVSLSDLTEAAIAFIRAINNFQGNQFIMDWYVNDHRVNHKTIEKAIRECREKVVISADGVVKNTRVYNLSTFRQYVHSLYLHPKAYGVSSYSEDYPEYFRNGLVPFFENEKLLKEAILKLFQLEGKKPLGFRGIYDSGCIFLGGKHRNRTPERFWGEALFFVSVAACERFLNPAAEQLESVLLLLADILKHTNGRIGVGPRKTGHASPYMTYFGYELDHADGSHLEAGFPAREWYSNYYVCGAEWMNYLSELPAKRIKGERKNADGVISFQQNKGLVVKSTFPVSEIDVSALSAVKKVLSSVLYPGKFTIDLNKYYLTKSPLYSMLPRSSWEVVPITSDEISVEGSVVTFSHQV